MVASRSPVVSEPPNGELSPLVESALSCTESAAQAIRDNRLDDAIRFLSDASLYVIRQKKALRAAVEATPTLKR